MWNCEAFFFHVDDKWEKWFYFESKAMTAALYFFFFFVITLDLMLENRLRHSVLYFFFFCRHLFSLHIIRLFFSHGSIIIFLLVGRVRHFSLLGIVRQFLLLLWAISVFLSGVRLFPFPFHNHFSITSSCLKFSISFSLTIAKLYVCTSLIVIERYVYIYVPHVHCKTYMCLFPMFIVRLGCISLHSYIHAKVCVCSCTSSSL